MFIDTLILSNEKWQDQDEMLLDYVSKERKERLLRYRFDIDRKLSLYSALIVHMRAVQQLNLKNMEVHFIKREDGKPILDGYPEFHFNISHTRCAVMCGFSNEEIGVDVEKINKAPFDIMRKCFTQNETDSVDTSVEDNPDFYKIWTRKEAYGKLRGIGITDDVFHFDTMQSDEKTSFETWREDDYMFSVCWDGEQKECIKRKITEEMIVDFFVSNKK